MPDVLGEKELRAQYDEALKTIDVQRKQIDSLKNDRTADVSWHAVDVRDYFAGLAMLAELVTAGALEEPREALREVARRTGRTMLGQAAHNSYQMADEMLEAREADE
jgi:hypothetical protein